MEKGQDPLLITDFDGIHEDVLGIFLVYIYSFVIVTY